MDIIYPFCNLTDKVELCKIKNGPTFLPILSELDEEHRFVVDVKEKKSVHALIYLFPLVLIYYEIVFRAFSVGGVFRFRTLLMIPFCCAYGGLGYLLSTISKNRRVNYYITAALLLLTAVPYGVEAFVYREFKVFFDIRTVVGGVGDVAGDFSDEVFRLILSFRGIMCILFFLLPTVLYLFLGTAPAAISGHARGMAAARSVAFYLISVMCVQLSPALSKLYGDEFSFNAAAGQFGFLTSLELDVRRNLFGGRATFQDVDIVEALATPEPVVTPEVTEEPVVYGLNEMELPLDDPFGIASDEIKELNAYVSSLTPSSKNKYTGMFAGKNLILITAEAFTKEVIDPKLTPTLYRMATKGVQFTDYYQFAGAGTTGGEYQHLFGLLPVWGSDSFPTMTSHSYNMAINQYLAGFGYHGTAYHNGTSTYYDRDKTHNRLGYSGGFLGMGNGLEDIMGADWDSSDKDLLEKTYPTYIDQQPFSCYYMTISAHTPYGFDDNTWAGKHKDEVDDLPYSDPVKGYLASNLELEEGLTSLIAALEAKGIADDTVICMTGDHFPYGLDNGANLGDLPYLSELYGYEVEDVFQRDHNCWLLWCGALEDQEPIVIDSPTSSLDILPTLYNLFGIEFDSRLFPGRDVFSDAPALVFTMDYSWKSDYGQYDNSDGTFTPADESVKLPANYVENMKTVVHNKVSYCSGVLSSDYYGYLYRGTY